MSDAINITGKIPQNSILLNNLLKDEKLNESLKLEQSHVANALKNNTIEIESRVRKNPSESEKYIEIIKKYIEIARGSSYFEPIMYTQLKDYLKLHSTKIDLTEVFKCLSIDEITQSERRDLSFNYMITVYKGRELQFYQ